MHFSEVYRKENNIGFLRLFLATLVVFSHSFSLVTGTIKADWMMVLTGNQGMLGGFAVNCFFALSGFLITQSWLRSAGLQDYLTRRVMRIYPGFLVTVLFGLFIIGPLVIADRHAYFSAFQPKGLLKTLLLFSYEIPGPFANAPYRPAMINGSLWSIPFEFRCYLLVALLGMVSLLKNRKISLVLLTVSAAAMYYKSFTGQYWHYGHWNNILYVLLCDLDRWPAPLTYFLAGMVFYLWQDRIPYSSRIAAACGLLLAAAIPLHIFAYALPVCSVYLLFYIAFTPTKRLDKVGRKNDFSYGIYLYSYAIQQTLIHFLPPIHPIPLFLLTMPITLVLAALSWFLIEKPANAFAHRRVKAQAAKEALKLA